jgi:hypothetical protein
MPRSSIIPIKPQRKRLLYPLHNLRQLQPIRRLNKKRHRRPGEPHPAQLKRKPFLRLAGRPPEKPHPELRLEQQLPIIR